MKFWNEILHTALLGSDKKMVDPAQLSPDLIPLAEQINAVTPDREDRFLRLAAVAFNYRQAGSRPFSQPGVSLPAAAAEEKTYCSTQAFRILGDLLTENNTGLIQLWLRLCEEKRQIVPPDILPLLLQAGTANRMLREGIIACGGKRAEWLGRLNTEWAFISGSGESTEELWQTGSPMQRRMILQQLRRDDPDMAREWLQQAWASEDVTTRLELLQALSVNLGERDLPFLESVSNDKGKKVKEQLLLFLKKIPASPMVALYRTTIQKVLLVKKERGVLGLGKKTTLVVTTSDTVEKAVYDSGIEKLSNKKELTDDEFLLYQLIQWVPLAFLESDWQLTTEELIRLFQEDPVGKKLFPALILSLVHFSDGARALETIKFSTVFYLDLIPLLPLDQQNAYSIKFFKESPDSIIEYATQRDSEWEMALTLPILHHAVKHPYQYNRTFFVRNIHLLPLAAGTFELPPPAEFVGTGNAWNNMLEPIVHLLQLKKQTLNAFK